MDEMPFTYAQWRFLARLDDDTVTHGDGRSDLHGKHD